MRFESDLEANLFELSDELVAGTYRPRRAVVFLVRHPKAREIVAADFRDRVVHHLLVSHFEPHWEKRFIYDSHACRRGKGIHAAVGRLKQFLGKVTANRTRKAYYLQLDVRGFFMAIHHRILFERLAAKERDPVILDLLRRIMFNNPLNNCLFKGCTPEDCRALPPHKTLFHSRPGCGLPIGNLTSQFFANVYLDSLDQFVKHQIGCRFYLRYCDDFLLLHHDPQVLQDWEEAIRAFLGNVLHLTLNEKRKLRPVTDGIDFLGYIVRPDYTLVRRRVVNHFKERLHSLEGELAPSGNETMEAVRSSGFSRLRLERSPFLRSFSRVPMCFEQIETTRRWFHSYLGHFSHAASHRLLESTLQAHPILGIWFRWESRWELRYPEVRLAFSLTEQFRDFRRQFPNHWLLIQVGVVWRVLVPRKDFELSRHLGIGHRFANEARPQFRRRLSQLRLPQAWFVQTQVFNGFIYQRTLQELCN